MAKRHYPPAMPRHGTAVGGGPSTRRLVSGRPPSSGRLVRFALTAMVAFAIETVVSPAYGAKTPTPTIPVSGASATVTVKDGLTASGTSVQPFQARFTIAGISFPNHEGGNHALPGNVFVHVTLRVTNLASSTRLIPFNGGNYQTMAIGISHDVPALGVNDVACVPPALDGLGIDQQVATQVANQWCVVSSDNEMVVVRSHQSKVVTFGGQVVSQTDAKPENFALIYCPADAATPTILPVGPGGTPTAVPG